MCLLGCFPDNPAFFAYPLKDTRWADLHRWQQWGAKTLGWTQKKWDEDSHIPPNFNATTTVQVPKNYQEGDDSLQEYIGVKKTTAWRREEGDQYPRLTTHYIITRILRYTVHTYAVLFRTITHEHTNLSRTTYLPVHGSQVARRRHRMARLQA